MKYHLPESKYERRAKLDSIVVHESDTLPTQDVGAAEIRRWHIEERGWIDIGYHFVIRRDGTIELGRPWWAVGAGVEGHNRDSIHVCLVGGGRGAPEGKENNYTPAQWVALRAVVLVIRELDPGEETIVGHRDHPGVTKTCPSFDVRQWAKKVGL